MPTPKFIVSTGAGSVKKPAIVAPDGRIVATASTPGDAKRIAAALNFAEDYITNHGLRA